MACERAAMPCLHARVRARVHVCLARARVCDTSWAAGGGGLQHTVLYGFAEAYTIILCLSAGVVFAVIAFCALLACLFWDYGGVNGRVLITRAQRRRRRGRHRAIRTHCGEVPKHDEDRGDCFPELELGGAHN